MDDLPKIVSVLIDHELLVQDWRRFYDALGVTDSRVVQWTNQFNQMSLPPYELFLNILRSWELEKGKKAATIESLCQALRSIQKLSVAERLETELGHSTLKSSTFPLWFNIGQSNRHFVGRENEIDQLLKIYKRGRDKIIIISGLRGIGKTELAKKFAEILYTNENVNCTFFNVGTEQSFHQYVFNLANEIGVKTQDSAGCVLELQLLFKEIVTYMKIKYQLNHWLIILDNVNNKNDQILSCLQTIKETEKVMAIIMSKYETIADETTVLFPLHEWESEEAVKFVKISLTETNEHQNIKIKKLSDRLGNHPLGLQHAAAYINKQQNSLRGKHYYISDYLIEFDAEETKISIMFDSKFREISDKFGKLVLITLNIAISKIESEGIVGKLAIQLLYRISYLDSSGIDVQNLKIFLDLAINNTDFEPDKFLRKAFELLQSYSIIKIENNIVNIYRLVQKCIRIKLETSNEEQLLLTSLVESIPSLFSKSQFTHVLSVWKYASKHEDLLQKFPKACINIARRLQCFGMYSEIFKFAKKNHQKLKVLLGKNNIHVLEMKEILSKALQEKESCEASSEKYSKLAVQSQEILYKEERLTLLTTENMAGVLFRVESIDAVKEVLDSLKQSNNDENLIITKHNLANVLLKRRDFDLVMKLFNEVLELGEKVLGEKHPLTLNTRQRMGMCFYLQLKYTEAVEAFEKVWEMRKAQLGEEHLRTIHSLFWLGNTYYALGREEKALEIQEQVLALQKKVYGSDNFDTIFTERWINACKMDIKRKLGPVEIDLD